MKLRLTPEQEAEVQRVLRQGNASTRELMASQRRTFNMREQSLGLIEHYDLAEETLQLIEERTQLEREERRLWLAIISADYI